VGGRAPDRQTTRSAEALQERRAAAVDELLALLASHAGGRLDRADLSAGCEPVVPSAGHDRRWGGASGPSASDGGCSRQAPEARHAGADGHGQAATGSGTAATPVLSESGTQTLDDGHPQVGSVSTTVCPERGLGVICVIGGGGRKHPTALLNSVFALAALKVIGRPWEAPALRCIALLCVAPFGSAGSGAGVIRAAYQACHGNQAQTLLAGHTPIMKN
jgi:hypothetical protein